jgi:hypothetical protein
MVGVVTASSAPESTRNARGSAEGPPEAGAKGLKAGSLSGAGANGLSGIARGVPLDAGAGLACHHDARAAFEPRTPSSQ